MGKVVRAIRWISTLGLSAEIDRERERCADLQARCERLRFVAAQHAEELRSGLRELGLRHKQSYKLLKRIRRLYGRATKADLSRLAEDFRNLIVIRPVSSECPSPPQRPSLDARIAADLPASIAASTLNTEASLAAAKGAGLGAAAGIGAWGLVSTFGSASTGTAIFGLSGAAASNATLAWFGGGALAAGGAGMAGGLVVLGGLVTLPFIGLTVVFSYRAARKELQGLKDIACKLDAGISAFHSYIELVVAAKGRTDSLQGTLGTALGQCKSEFMKVKKQIYPIWLFSYIYRWIKGLASGRYFSDSEIETLARFGDPVMTLMTAGDSPVFNTGPRTQSSEI